MSFHWCFQSSLGPARKVIIISIRTQFIKNIPVWFTPTDSSKYKHKQHIKFIKFGISDNNPKSSIVTGIRTIVYQVTYKSHKLYFWTYHMWKCMELIFTTSLSEQFYTVSQLVSEHALVFTVNLSLCLTWKKQWCQCFSCCQRSYSLMYDYEKEAIILVNSSRKHKDQNSRNNTEFSQ